MAALKEKQTNPAKYKQYKYGDHKLQKDQQSLPHPYMQEIEDYDFKVKVRSDFPIKIQPRKYAGLDQTAFLYVETEE